MSHFGSVLTLKPGPWCWVLALLLLSLSFSEPTIVLAETGTFIDRELSTDLRVVSYNPLFDTIFPQIDPTQADKFERIVTALDPDILNLQEINRSAADVVELLNRIAPPASGSWHAHQGRDNVIASKYPLSMTETNTSPAGQRGQAIALVDLPDEQFGADFYFMNNHYRCCGGESRDHSRQLQSDAIVNWLRDARSPGGHVHLSPGTPFAVVGDLNIVGGPQPLDTLIDGNIINETRYGLDSAPDWDGSNLTDAHPVHNGTLPEDYTWRDDNQIFDPGRLDYVIYTDSALDVGSQFVLNTVAMSAAELATTGLQTFDVTLDAVGATYDHLPLVVDFRVFEFSVADFNFDRAVNAADLTNWQAGFGFGSSASRNLGDADGDLDVDGHDFLSWQRDFVNLTNSLTAVVPEPTPLALLLSATLAFSLRYNLRRTIKPR